MRRQRAARGAVCRRRAGKDGVADVLGELFSYGTTTLDRLAFQKALDDIAANETAGYDFSRARAEGGLLARRRAAGRQRAASRASRRRRSTSSSSRPREFVAGQDEEPRLSRRIARCDGRCCRPAIRRCAKRRPTPSRALTLADVKAVSRGDVPAGSDDHRRDRRRRRRRRRGRRSRSGSADGARPGRRRRSTCRACRRTRLGD